MKKLLFFCLPLFCFQHAFAEEKIAPDTVSVGLYINSVHNIDFKDKEYTISMWVWFKYRNADFDFSRYLEVPMAKEVDKSYYNVDTLDDGRIYMLMKLQCVMKDNWKIQNFPFDHQKLRFSIENSQYDSDSLVFVEDTVGEHYSKWTTSGWKINPDSFRISTGTKTYQTGFGDPELDKPETDFSVFRMQIVMDREPWSLFLKLFLGMYVSFLLSYLCFFINPDNVDSRFSLSVGSLFAVIGNKYIVDSALPESTSFTLVDSLHGLTMAFVFAVVACSAYVLKLIKKGNPHEVKHFDRIASRVLLAVYILLNVALIWNAYTS
ncbi:MAG: hypothetical protein V4590_02420 [Bacteroidota bacterium]